MARSSRSIHHFNGWSLSCSHTIPGYLPKQCTVAKLRGFPPIPLEMMDILGGFPCFDADVFFCRTFKVVGMFGILGIKLFLWGWSLINTGDEKIVAFFSSNLTRDAYFGVNKHPRDPIAHQQSSEKMIGVRGRIYHHRNENSRCFKVPLQFSEGHWVPRDKNFIAIEDARISQQNRWFPSSNRFKWSRWTA